MFKTFTFQVVSKRTVFHDQVRVWADNVVDARKAAVLAYGETHYFTNDPVETSPNRTAGISV